MPAEDLAARVPRAHVQVRVEFSVHRVHRAAERDDLKAAREVIGGVLFGFRIENADREVVRRAERLHRRELDLLLFGKLVQLVEDLFAAVDPRDDRVAENFVFHLCLRFIV